jgi:hypothetical protein
LRSKASIITEDGEPIGFKVNGKAFYIDESGSAEAQIEDLKGFNISAIPKGMSLLPLDDRTIILEGEISSSKKYPGIANMDIHIYRKFWDHKFGVSQYLAAMKKAIEIRAKTARDVKFNELEDDGVHAFFRYDILLSKDCPISEALTRFQQVVKEIEGHTERILDKAEIPSETLKDEPRYTTEVLLPLFRSMGFVDIQYNHGNREFGKDVTFSEIDKFGVKRNYGVQVKIGDISGHAGSDLDKIIAQIDDSFAMPYIDTTSREKRYISDIIIAISGRFTGNAKDKIVEKLKRRNIYFLDIDKTQELISKYMRK